MLKIKNNKLININNDNKSMLLSDKNENKYNSNTDTNKK